MPDLNPSHNQSSNAPPARSSNRRTTSRSSSSRLICLGLRVVSILFFLQILTFVYFAPEGLEKAAPGKFIINALPKFNASDDLHSESSPMLNLVVIGSILCTICASVLGMERGMHVVSRDLTSTSSASTDLAFKKTFCRSFIACIFLMFPVFLLIFFEPIESNFYLMEVIFTVLSWAPLAFYMLLLLLSPNKSLDVVRDVEAQPEPDNHDRKGPYSRNIL